MSSDPFGANTASANESLAIDVLAALMRDATTLGVAGVITLRLQPQAALLRVRPERLSDFYAAIDEVIRASLRQQDRLLRTARFEWTILLPAIPSPAALTLAMLRLTRVFERPPVPLLRFAAQFDARCGGVLFPDTHGDPVHLLQSARIACLEAEQAEGRYAHYAPELETRSLEQQSLAQEVALALNSGRLDLWLQPQVDLAGGRCIGAEVLLRWQRASGEWVPPPVIIGVIAHSGMSAAFNRWLFHRTMQLARGLAAAGIDIPLSVNLAAEDLQDRDLAMLLGQALQTFGVPAARIRLEITETALVSQTGAAQSLVGQLQQLGVSLSIDDFGTGYSGMTHLRLLPVAEIKIDQMFVRDLANSEVDRTIVQSIIELGQRLKIDVLAEGVETAAAARVLHDMGCRAAQGYLYGRPMPLANFIAWHEARGQQDA